ncbi:MAG: hypothetical protein ACFFDH_01875 [Promethearchaeota archaeon]
MIRDPHLIWESDSVDILKATPNGKFAIGAKKNLIKIWDISTQKFIRDLEGHKKGITSIAITPDNKYIISCSDDETIKIWDINTGGCLLSLDDEKNVNEVNITSDGRYFITNTAVNTRVKKKGWVDVWSVKIWDMSVVFEEGKRLDKKKEKENKWEYKESEFLEITHDNKFVLSVPKDDNIIEMRDIFSGELVKRFEGHTDKINSIVCIDNNRFISCSDDQTIKFWETMTGECIQTLEGHKEEVKVITISHDYKILVSGSKKGIGGVVFVWDLSMGKYIRTYDCRDTPTSIVLTNDHILVGSWRSFEMFNFIKEPAPELLTKLGIIPDEYQGVELHKKEIAALMDLETAIKKPIPQVNQVRREIADESDNSDVTFNLGFVAKDGHVIELCLAKEFRGKNNILIQNFKSKLEILPDSIENLEHLTTLILKSAIETSYKNDYRGLPETFGNLKSLKYLDLRDITLRQGFFPESFGNLKSLQFLDLRESHALSEFPDSFGGLKFLENLYISGWGPESISFTEIPESFGSLDLLKELTILGAKKLKYLPETIGNLKNLEKIIMENSGIKILPESIGNLKALKSLTSIKGSLTKLPDSIKKLTSLETLNLSANQLEILPESIGDVHSLKNINLSENKLSKLPESFGNLKNLQSLNLNLNKDIKKLPDSFGNLNSLKNLYFSGNINMFNNLETLPESFGDLEYLQQLYLNNNNLIELPRTFNNLKSLQILSLGNNKSLSSLPESFDNLSKLMTLDLSGCNFTEIPEILWRLVSLTNINLKNNPFNSEENLVIQKSLQEIMAYLRKKSAIEIFISHAIVDFETYKVKQLSEFLEQQKEVYQAYYCESDLVGNIDDFMNDYLPRCQMVIFIATQKSVFNSPDCTHELELARKMAIQIIPIKGRDVSWEDMVKIGLNRELGMEFEMDNFDGFCQNLYQYVYNYKRNIDLYEDGIIKTVKKAHKKVIEDARVIAIEEKQVDNGLDKIRNLLKVSTALPIGRLAKILGMDEDDIWDQVYLWAQEFGFTINGELLEFTSGRKDDFISKLEKQLK